MTTPATTIIAWFTPTLQYLTITITICPAIKKDASSLQKHNEDCAFGGLGMDWEYKMYLRSLVRDMG